MKKKITVVALVICLLAIAIVGGTMAYFTDSKVATNTFTVGNVLIELTELGWTATGQNDAPEVYPGEALAKDPTVKNVGANPCFVRIKVEGLDCLGADKKITYRTDFIDDKLGDGWYLHTDGYYYYYVGGENGVGGTGVLAAKETTDALFDQIVIPTTLTNKDGKEFPSASNLNVVVTAQAVQAQGAMSKFSDVQAMSVVDIAKWFKTCGLTPSP